MALTKKYTKPLSAVGTMLLLLCVALHMRFGQPLWSHMARIMLFVVPPSLYVVHMLSGAHEERHLKALVQLAYLASAVFHSLNGALVWLLFDGRWRAAFVVVLCYGVLSTMVFVYGFARPRMRSELYLWVVTYPSTFCFTWAILCVLTMPLLPLFDAVRYQQAVLLLPFALSILGMWHSLHETSWMINDVDLSTQRGDSAPEAPQRANHRVRQCDADLHHCLPNTDDKLRIIQLTDFHIGSFYSVQRLQQTCEIIVKLDPDLVCLTGDFFTPEGDHTKHTLLQGLKPLTQLKGRVFACLGNHDKESSRVLRIVQRELRELHIELLVDTVVSFDSRLGPVDILGLDWRPGGVEAHVTGVFERLRMEERARSSVLTVALLHDPQSFQYFPSYGKKLLTLSGHTHGGQVGLVSFGLPYTLVGLATGHPDHGLWQCRRNFLYVHRGQGFRSLASNFLARVGVPNENSVMEIALH